MYTAIRMTTALLTLVGAIGLAHAEGGPGDSGAGATDGSASAVLGTPQASPHAKRAHTAKSGAKMKHAEGANGAGNGAKADGPMSNASAVGKGG